MPIIPKREGISGARQRLSDESAGSPLQRIKNGATLTDLQDDYELFTYAPLFLYGGLEHNLVQEWINKYDHQQVVFIVRLDKPVVHLGADPAWDHTLWAVEKSHWKSLATHIANVGLVDKGKKLFTRTLCQQLSLPDVIKNSTTLQLPTVKVTVFSVDSNRGCIAFTKPSPLQGFKPTLKFYPPEEETVTLANALFQEKEKPYADIQKEAQ